MKANPLRLPLYILYTLRQGKIFHSRRIKSTVIAYKATLLHYQTIKHSTILRKPEWKNGAIFDPKKSGSKHRTESTGRDSTALREDWLPSKPQPVIQLINFRASPPAPCCSSMAVTSRYLQVFWLDLVVVTTERSGEKSFFN